jgi:hypothetical protein
MTTELGLAVKRKSATPSSGTNIRRDHSIKEVSKLVDIDLCIGCKAREVACKEWNDLEVEETHNFGGYKSHEDLTASTWDLMRFNEVDLDDGGIAWHIRKDSWRGLLPAPKTPTSPRSSGTCAGASERRRQQGGVRGRPLYPGDRVASASNDCDYEDLGGDYFARRNHADARERYLIRELQALGHRVTVESGA